MTLRNDLRSIRINDETQLQGSRLPDRVDDLHFGIGRFIYHIFQFLNKTDIISHLSTKLAAYRQLETKLI